MKVLVSILGYMVVFGYLLKIIFQMYIKHRRGEELGFGQYNTLNTEYFRPIKHDVGAKLEPLKKILNSVNYLVAIYLIILLIHLFFSGESPARDSP